MKVTAFLISIVLILVLCPGPACPDEFRLVPSLAVSEKYNDNVLFATSDRQKDWITVLSPGLELVNKTERLDLNLKARLDDIHYTDLRDYNAVDQFYSGQVRFAVTNRLILGARAGFTQDSQPDRDITDTGLALSTGRRESQNYGAFVSYQLQDLTTAALSYRYDTERYNRVGYTDWWSQAVNLDLVHDLDKWVRNTKGRLNFGYAYYHFQGNIIDNYTATLGFSRNFSEKWSVLLDAGARYTQSAFEAFYATLIPPATIVISSEERSTRGWGAVGQLAIAYKDDFTTGNVTLKKDIMPASGRNSATDRTLVTFDLRRRFTYEFQGFITGGYYINTSDSGGYAAQEIDERTMRGGAGLRYEFTRDAYLEASYEYINTQYRRSDTQADRNLFLVRFFIQHALLK